MLRPYISRADQLIHGLPPGETIALIGISGAETDNLCGEKQIPRWDDPHRGGAALVDQVYHCRSCSRVGRHHTADCQCGPAPLTTLIVHTFFQAPGPIDNREAQIEHICAIPGAVVVIFLTDESIGLCR